MPDKAEDSKPQQPAKEDLKATETEPAKMDIGNIQEESHELKGSSIEIVGYLLKKAQEYANFTNSVYSTYEKDLHAIQDNRRELLNYSSNLANVVKSALEERKTKGYDKEREKEKVIEIKKIMNEINELGKMVAQQRADYRVNEDRNHAVFIARREQINILMDLCFGESDNQNEKTAGQIDKIFEQKDGIYEIAQVAEMLNINPQTLRNWEKHGLVTPLRANNFRIYTEEHIKRCKEINEYAGRGISLDGIKELFNQKKNQ